MCIKVILPRKQEKKGKKERKETTTTSSSLIIVIIIELSASRVDGEREVDEGEEYGKGKKTSVKMRMRIKDEM